MATTTAKNTITLPTGVLAVIGAGDFAVAQVRTAVATLPQVIDQFEARVSQVQADVQKRVTEFDAKTLQAQAVEAPNKAAATLLTTVSKAQAQAETTYETLAERGLQLVEKVRTQPSTQAFVDQYDVAIAKGKAAVTVARKAADETVAAVKGTITVGRKEVETLVGTTTEQAEVSAKKTQTAAKKTATTARKGATATKSAAKGARTSATKAASAAADAAKDAAEKVGD